MTDQIPISAPEGEGSSVPDAPTNTASSDQNPGSGGGADVAPVAASSFTARMFDHELGKYVDVPDQDVTDAIKSNRFTFPQGYKIPTIDADGNLAETPAEAAFNDFTHHGVQFATPQLSQAAQAQSQKNIIKDVYGGSPLTAAIAGAARAGTLGASDVALMLQV